MALVHKADAMNAWLRSPRTQHWFLYSILLVIFLAYMNPELGARGGFLRPEITVKYLVVSMIFFISGLNLPSQDLKRAVSSLKLHAIIQGFSLVVVPLLVQGLNLVLRLVGLQEGLLLGLVALSCMPPPVSSAVILTSAAGGNEAVAVFNSVFGSLMGIFVTPFLLLLLLGFSPTVSLWTTCLQLGQTVVFPLMVGQGVQRHLSRWLSRHKPHLSATGSCMLLLIIYTTFCDTFLIEEHGVDALSALTILFIVVFLQVSFLYLTFYIGSTLTLSAPNTVAIMFSGTHKSLTLGVPLLRIMYEGSAQLSEITLPLLIYHPLQILMGGLLVPRLKQWMQHCGNGLKRRPSPV